MKKLFALFATLAFSASAHATLYHFTYTGNPAYANKVVTGSFEGTANGNVISQLSNISVFIDGVAFNNNGALFGSSTSSNYSWVSGGAQASFDGTQNNFLFIDVDYPNSYSYSNYFYSIANGQSTYAANYNGVDYQYLGGSAIGNWSVTTDVPEPASAALFGISIAALAAARRRKARG